MVSIRCQNSRKSENIQILEVEIQTFFRNLLDGTMIHHYNCQAFTNLLFFTVSFYDFLFEIIVAANVTHQFWFHFQIQAICTQLYVCVTVRNVVFSFRRFFAIRLHSQKCLVQVTRTDSPLKVKKVRIWQLDGQHFSYLVCHFQSSHTC